MAVNFFRINLLRSPMAYPLALWNVYTQIWRYNCENKDNLEINFINKLHEKSLKRAKSSRIIQSQINDKIDEHDEWVYDEDERKLIELLRHLNENDSDAKWINIRNSCIDLICLKGSINFFEKFMRILTKLDPQYCDENDHFLKYLHELVTWRDQRTSRNTERLIENLCELYISHYQNDEQLRKIKIIIQALLEEILSKHGSSAVVYLKKSFKRMSDETKNFDALYLLWKNLFDSFWFSDQQAADELLASHYEIRRMLATRSKQLCFGYFCENNTDQVNKLIQIYLKYKMRTSIVETLKLYLAFEIWRKNSSAATEIVKLYLELNIPLNDSENRKYLDLLLKRQRQDSSEQRGKMSEKIDVENYKFKF